MPVQGRESARAFHEATTHTVERVRAGGRLLDVENMPLPLKHYPDLEPIPLPVEMPERSAAAVDVLSGRVEADARPIDLGELTRLLFFSAGVTRRARMVGGRPMFFRAAPSAGALYPTEVYVVCGDLPDLRAGVYHFDPVELALRRLRDDDNRRFLARAAADASVATAPATLVLTGIPWRTTWKYEERGYRHLFWDSGTILGNLLGVAEAAGIAARVLTGFVDDDVCHLLGLGDPEEHPLEVVPLRAGASGAAGASEADASADGPVGGRPPAIAPRVHPLSAHPRRYERIAEVHRAGSLDEVGAVEEWRAAASRLGTPATRAVETSPTGEETLEDVIVRRGSTRRYAREAVGEDALRWGLAAASRPVPGDLAGEGSNLLEHFAAVHAVEGVDPGAYRWWGGDLEAIREGDLRRETAHLCLDQPLGGDCAFGVFHCAALDAVLDRLGARGYRAALVEAGVVVGRLHLAAYALGYGASGITFYDEEVSAFLGTRAAPMMVSTVGVPGYRSRPGKRPSEVDRLRVQLT